MFPREGEEEIKKKANGWQSQLQQINLKYK